MNADKRLALLNPHARALAAVVVAAARHVDPSLTPDIAVKELEKIVPRPVPRCADAIAARAPDDAVPGGRAALKTLRGADCWTPGSRLLMSSPLEATCSVMRASRARIGCYICARSGDRQFERRPRPLRGRPLDARR